MMHLIQQVDHFFQFLVRHTNNNNTKTIINKELKKLSMKEIRFQSAIYEIYTTERDYVEDLDLLIEVKKKITTPKTNHLLILKTKMF